MWPGTWPQPRNVKVKGIKSYPEINQVVEASQKEFQALAEKLHLTGFIKSTLVQQNKKVVDAILINFQKQTKSISYNVINFVKTKLGINPNAIKLSIDNFESKFPNAEEFKAFLLPFMENAAKVK
jgi:hypothetical protein